MDAVVRMGEAISSLTPMRVMPRPSPCPLCNARAIYHAGEDGRWQTTPSVSCSNKQCERHVEAQRRARFWYLAHAPEHYRGGLKAWELWDDASPVP
jgi:hypothetical protein